MTLLEPQNNQKLPQRDAFSLVLLWKWLKSCCGSPEFLPCPNLIHIKGDHTAHPWPHHSLKMTITTPKVTIFLFPICSEDILGKSSCFMGQKRKKNIIAGILTKGPIRTLGKHSAGCRGSFLAGENWRNLLCPKTLFFTVFSYLDWI